MNSIECDTVAGVVFEPVELTEEDKKNRVLRLNVQFSSNSAQNRCPECKFCEDYTRGVELLKVAVQKSLGVALG